MIHTFRRPIIFVLCLASVFVYASRTVSVFLAQRRVEARRPEALEYAVSLVPDDAEFRRLLGLEYIVANQDYAAGLANLRKAASLNPDSAQAWLDLASAYQIVGDVQAEDRASRMGVEAEPNNPETLAEAAELELTSGEVAAALPLFRRSLEQNPKAGADLIPLCWRATRDVSLMFDQALPAQPQSEFDFLRELTKQHEDAAADEAWHRILALQQAFPPQQSFFYLDYLFQERSTLRLDRAWDDLTDSHPEFRNYERSENRIVNPGFELPFLNGGLDWRYEPAQNMEVSLDDAVAHSGRRSLCFSYSGKPAYDSGWKQLIPVHPGSDYAFSVWVKTDRLTSSSGPRLAIVDAYTSSTLAMTDDSLDTHDWHMLQETLRVPFETHLVAVKIVRSPAITGISGRMWIDDLKLVRR